MACRATDSSIDLATASHMSLDDARGTLIRVTRGTVWITQEHSYDDVILHAGDAWTVERDGVTIIQAHDDARLCLPQPARPWWSVAWQMVNRRTRNGRAFMRRAGHAWASLDPRHPTPYF
jgi:hypothetical protein